jgi:hypothetical protein
MKSNLSKEGKYYLLFYALLKRTGIDFCERLTDLANNEKKTELDCHEFIKKNYPTAKLSLEDNRNISLLLDFYLEKVDQHDYLEDSTFGFCEPKECTYDKPWRSRFLGNFIDQPVLVTGFFPKD